MSKSKSDDHLKLYQDQRITNSIHNAVPLIMDIQAIFHEVFGAGLNHYDLNILKRCKTKLSEILKELSLYNLHMDYSAIEHSSDGKIKPLTGSYPSTFLTFNERSPSFVGEDVELVSADNERVASCIERINSIIASQPKPDINSVREKYANTEDGYCLLIHLNETETLSSIVEKIDALKDDVRHLSLDELVVSQQFSDVYFIEQKNPYWLKNQLNLGVGIRINIHNIDSFAPFYYLSVLLECMKKKIEVLSYGVPETETELKLQYSYDSLNQSHVQIIANIILE